MFIFLLLWLSWRREKISKRKLGWKEGNRSSRFIFCNVKLDLFNVPNCNEMQTFSVRAPFDGSQQCLAQRRVGSFLPHLILSWKPPLSLLSPETSHGVLWFISHWVLFVLRFTTLFLFCTFFNQQSPWKQKVSATNLISGKYNNVKKTKPCQRQKRKMETRKQPSEQVPPNKESEIF